MIKEKKNKWLTILGIGNNNFLNFSSFKKKILYTADILLTTKRYIKNIPKINAEIHIWDNPLYKSIQKIINWRNRGLNGEKIVILSSGNPMHFGIGATLVKFININEIHIIPNSSSFSLAASRLGWDLNKVKCISVHGRSINLINKAIEHNSFIITLTSNNKTINTIATILVNRGFGKSKITILENMNNNNEHIITSTADNWDNKDIAHLNSVAIECIANKNTPIIPNIAGLNDDYYIHDGQLTKSDVRAATINKLLPTPNSIMWDLGAGNGSVGIEYLRIAKNSICHSVEKSKNRIQNIKINANNLGVPHIKIYHGNSIDFIKKLSKPEAVFIGGGLTLNLFNEIYNILPINGRIVINAITIESISILNKIYKNFSNNLTQLNKLSFIKLDTGSIKKIYKSHIFKNNITIKQLSLIKTEFKENNNE